MPTASHDHQNSGDRQSNRDNTFYSPGISNTARLSASPLFFFLAIYLLTLLENFLIILAIHSDGQLCKPMYFFLSHLSFLELWYVMVISPKMLVDFLNHDKIISSNGCITQLYFFVTFVCPEYILLAVMAFDHYVAICNLLHYPVIMTNQFCGALAREDAGSVDS